MFCKYCGSKIDNDARFCCSCGKQLIETDPEPPTSTSKTEDIPKSTYTAPKPTPVANIPSASPIAVNLLPMIAAIVLGFFKFIYLFKGPAGATTALGTLANIIAVDATVLVILALFKVLKKLDLFYSIAMFALAFSQLLEIILNIDSTFYVLIVPLLTMLAFLVAGIHYLLHGKIFNNIIKMIMAFVVWMIGVNLLIRYISIGVSFYIIFSSLMISCSSGLLILSYNPNK